LYLASISMCGGSAVRIDSFTAQSMLCERIVPLVETPR
jgi:hypothetical protein